jgi:putative copper resistance protein D
VAWARLLVLVALLSGLVGLLARTAVFEGRPQAALEPRAVWHAVLDTRPGLVWLARHGLLLVLGALLMMRANLADTRNWLAFRGEGLVLAALALGLVSGSSHAAAVTPDATWALAVDVAHLLGTGVWMGGLVPLALLLRAACRPSGADARPYAVLAAHRFSRVALVTMIVLMATGAMNAVEQVESVAGLAGTVHGRLLLAKLAVLIPIVALAALNRARLLPALSGPDTAVGRPAMRRLAAFVGVETGLALVLLALVVAMTLTTPARHAPPVWPFPFRLSFEPLLDAPAMRWRTFLGSQLAVFGVVALAASLLARRWRRPVLAGALALVIVGAIIGLPPIVVDAYPTTYRRPLVTYNAASIAPGMSIYRTHCASCHGPTGAGDGPAMQERRRRLADLRSPPASRRHAGELYWLVSHGMPERGMPGFDGRLGESERWDVINFIRALGAAAGSPGLGGQVEPDRPWLIAPDFTVSVGPLPPGALRDYRGRRIVLIVLYTLPESGPRLAELARSYNLLWIMGAEVIAVPTDTSPDAIRDLGALSPPALFPVVTDGAAAIVETYRMFAPGPHAELLIDRQGYLRAIWKGETGGVAPMDTLTRQVEVLNAEKNVPPFPDDHVH